MIGARRGALKAIASGLTGALIAPAADAVSLLASEPDAELIAAGRLFEAAETEYRRRVYAEEADNDPAGFERWRHADYYPAALAVRALTATTLAGFRAKAAAVYAELSDGPPYNISLMAPAMWDLVCELAGQPYIEDEEDEEGYG